MWTTAPDCTYIIFAAQQINHKEVFFPDLQTTRFCLKNVHALLIQWTPLWEVLTAALWKVTLTKRTIFFCKNVHMSCLPNLKKGSVQIWPRSRQHISSHGHFDLNGTYIQRRDSQGHIRSIVLPLTSAESQYKSCILQIMAANMGLLLTPVWFRVKFPFPNGMPTR